MLTNFDCIAGDFINIRVVRSILTQTLTLGDVGDVNVMRREVVFLNESAWSGVFEEEPPGGEEGSKEGNEKWEEFLHFSSFEDVFRRSCSRRQIV